MPYIGHSPEVAQRRYESVDDISGSFNGSTTSFALQVGGVTPAPFPVASENVLISVGGVIQEPDGGGTNGFQLTGTNIVFSSAPAAGQSFFGVILAGADYVTAGHAFPDGDAAGPSITFANDLDTGVFRAGSGAIGFGDNGVERVRITSGNVGIGETAPANLLHVKASDTGVSPHASAQIVLERSGTNYLQLLTANTGTQGILFGDTDDNDIGKIVYDHSSDHLRFEVAASEAARIDSSGRLLLGTTTEGEHTADDLTVATSGDTGISIRSGTSSSGKLYFSDGTSSADEYRGFVQYAHSSNAMSFGTDSTERARFDSSGRFLVNKSGTPSAGEGSEAYVFIQGNTTSGSGPAVLGLARGQSAAEMSNGASLGIVTFTDDSGNDFAQIKGACDGTAGSDDHPGRISFLTTPDNSSSPSERLRIGKTGDTTFRGDEYGLGVRSAASSSSVITAYFGAHSSTSMSTGSITFEVYTNGNVKNSNNSYGQISDERLKENIVNAPSQWDDIKSLQIRKYNFRDGNGYDTHTQIGLVAQEVEAVSPGLVQETPVRGDATPVLDAEGNELEATKSVVTSVLYMKAVKALQEAQTRIETLETQNTAQQTQIDDLLARVTALEAA